MPITYQAFLDYKKNSVHLSAKAFNVLKRRLNGEKVEQENSGLSKREWSEMIDIMETK